MAKKKKNPVYVVKTSVEEVERKWQVTLPFVHRVEPLYISCDKDAKVVWDTATLYNYDGIRNKVLVIKNTDRLHRNNLSDLGWMAQSSAKVGKYKYIDECGDAYLMRVFAQEEDLSLVVIKELDPGIMSNPWENNSTLFHGSIKSIDELIQVMKFINIIER